MNLRLIAGFVFLMPSLAFAKGKNSSGDVNVDGYYKANGTYVEPHTRSTPNAYKWDNKSYQPSQPAYNTSYSEPKKNYGSDYYKPSKSRYDDNNPYNDSAPTNTNSED